MSHELNLQISKWIPASFYKQKIDFVPFFITGWLYRKKFIKVKNASLTIQRWARGYLARRKVNNIFFINFCFQKLLLKKKPLKIFCVLQNSRSFIYDVTMLLLQCKDTFVDGLNVHSTYKPKTEPYVSRLVWISR